MYSIEYPTPPVIGCTEADFTAVRLELEYNITGKLLGHILYRLARTLSPLAGPDPGDAHVWLRVFDNLDKETQQAYVDAIVADYPQGPYYDVER